MASVGSQMSLGGGVQKKKVMRIISCLRKNSEFVIGIQNLLEANRGVYKISKVWHYQRNHKPELKQPLILSNLIPSADPLAWRRDLENEIELCQQEIKNKKHPPPRPQATENPEQGNSSHSVELESSQGTFIYHRIEAPLDDQPEGSHHCLGPAIPVSPLPAFYRGEYFCNSFWITWQVHPYVSEPRAPTRRMANLKARKARLMSEVS